MQTDRLNDSDGDDPRYGHTDVPRQPDDDKAADPWSNAPESLDDTPLTQSEAVEEAFRRMKLF